MSKEDEIKIKLIGDSNKYIPEYKTPGAVAFDLTSRISLCIKPGEIVKVPLGVAIKPPDGYWILMAARSSLHKKGLQMINSIGIFDCDYCGNEDEYVAVIRNFTDEIAEIKEGERIMQAAVMPLVKFPIKIVEELESKNRGGVGSTGFI